MIIRSAKFAQVPVWVATHREVRGNAGRLATYVALRVVAFEHEGREWRSDRELAAVLGELVGLGADAVRKHLRELRSAGIIGGSAGEIVVINDEPAGEATGEQDPQSGEGDPQSGEMVPHAPLLTRREREETSNEVATVVVGSPRNDIWDALTEALGPAETRSERNIRGKTITELLEVGATPEQIIERCQEYRRRMPDVSLTHTALLKWWSTLGQPAVASQAKAPGLEGLARVMSARQERRGVQR